MPIQSFMVMIVMSYVHQGGPGPTDRKTLIFQRGGGGGQGGGGGWRVSNIFQGGGGGGGGSGVQLFPGAVHSVFPKI